MTDTFTSVNLSGIDLNLLFVLHAVLETRSVSAAAQRLHVTSPAVSNALSRLRETLGAPLFVKRGRGLAPTPKALELAPVLARAFAEIGTSLDSGATFDPLLCTREFVLALSDADQIATLPAVSGALRRKLPKSKLRVVSLDTLISTGGLGGELVDAAIGPKTAAPGVHSAPAYVEDGVIVVRKDHPRIKRTMTPAQFNAEGHVDLHLLLGKAGVGHRQAEEAFERAGLKRNIVVTVPTFFAAANVVAHSDCIVGMPLRVARALEKPLGLRVVKTPGTMQFEMHLLWHERTHRDAAATAFRDVLLRSLSRGREGKS